MSSESGGTPIKATPRMVLIYEKRKEMPMGTGVLDYFPNALAQVAACSYAATQQHHPGEAMHWDRGKSGDHADALLRHLADRGTYDTDGILHSAKVAWRALAILQEEEEKRCGLPHSRGSTPVARIATQPL